jgi:sugar phosphate isomerase/epimerase
MQHISLACLTVMDVTPPEAVMIACVTGYRGVSLAAGNRFLPPGMAGYKVHSVLDDPALRRETLQQSRRTGIALDLLEGVILSPALDVRALPEVFDVMQELGIPQMATFHADPDRGRAQSCLAALCELAAARGITVCIEFHPDSGLRSIDEAAALIDSAHYPGLGILVDALHLARGGSTPSDVARIDPRLIACAQFCDGPATSPDRGAYRHEAMFERQIPGEGALPLIDLLGVLPENCIIYLEIPMKSFRDRGIGARDCAQRAMEGMRRLQWAASKTRHENTADTDSDS